jgi:hypothetical protein
MKEPTMNTKHTLESTARRLLPLGLVAALAVGCGGGGDEPTPPPAADPLAAVPADASQSTAGMASYLKTLAANPSEDHEPVDVATFAPPTPEDTEPEPLS